MKCNKPQTIFFLPILLIIIVGFLIYSNSLHNGFHFDDMFFIVDKPEIRNIDDVNAIWHAHSHPARFVAFYTFALNYHFHQYKVFGYHVFNLIIHLINALLVWWMVQLIFLTPRMREDPLNRVKKWLALFAALIFVAHPLQTQGVTYICQRFASLATLFYLLSICLFLKGRLKVGWISFTYFFGAGISALLGMFTKQIVFTLPIILILIELIFIRKDKVKWPVIIFTALFLLIVPSIFSFNPSILNIHHASESHDGDRLTPTIYFLTQMPVLLTYLKLLFFPIGQNVDYDFPAYSHFFVPQVFLPFLLLSIIFLSSLMILKRHRLLAFAILWFFVTISVESSFITIKNVIFEHRMYLPMAGCAIFLTVLIFKIVREEKRAVFILSTIVIVLSVLTYQRNFVWRDGITLWSDVIKKSPEKGRPHVSLAIAYIQDEKLNEALDQLNLAIKYSPQDYKAYNNLGLVYNKKGLYEEAIKEYSHAIELKADNPISYSNRADAYREIGQNEKAYQNYNEAIRLNPRYAEAYINRGVFFGRNENLELALKDFMTAIQINPTLPESYNNRGIVYQRQRFFDLAQADFTHAIRIKPDYADALYNRGNVYKETGQFLEALDDYNRALKIRNNYSQVYNNRGIIYGLDGKDDLALHDFNLATQYDPNYSAAYFNRSLVYLKQGSYQEALDDTLKAKKLGKEINDLYIQQIESLLKKQKK
ncbi:MAG: tetratricopeptide repeat protein [Candidatus Omnitrophica bacterium]|nr:tetratricopeptide repeat protein [Candidatus Omnitrophota bacterium]